MRGGFSTILFARRFANRCARPTRLAPKPPMTPSTPAQPSIPPFVAHCTHCLPVCAELSVTGSSPPQTFSRWLFKNQFKAAWRVGPPQFWLGALAGTVAPHPSPKATSRAIFDDFHTGDRCRWSVQASQWPIPASGHCNNSPATGLSAVGPFAGSGMLARVLPAPPCARQGQGCALINRRVLETAY